MKNVPVIYQVAAFGIVAAFAYVLVRGVKGAASDVAGAAVDVVSGASSGAVLGIGDAFGVPRTDANACQRALNSGDSWAASFACPAGTFITSSATRLYDWLRGGPKPDTPELYFDP